MLADIVMPDFVVGVIVGALLVVAAFFAWGLFLANRKEKK